jgi:CBS domain-containing protein
MLQKGRWGVLAMYEFLQETVETNMTTPVKSVAPKTTVRDLYRFFEADDFDAYPVVRDDKLVGVVSKLDALKVFTLTRDEILPHYEDRMAMPVDAIMTCEVVAVEPDASLQRVLQMLVQHRVKSLPVVDRWRQLVGVIAREDVMRALFRCTEH